MKIDQQVITKKALDKSVDAIKLVEASLKAIKPYYPGKIYSPKEREPYDALSDRFTRAVEISLKFFRSYEKLMYGENSESTRDLLNRMEKLELISSVILWLQMRDLRNRIVHDYLPGEIKEIYDSIMDVLGNELKNLKYKITEINIE